MKQADRDKLKHNLTRILLKATDPQTKARLRESLRIIER